MHIVICDDIPDLCSILKKQLRKLPYLKPTDTIAEYHSAAELLESIQDITPDMLFLDIDMPGMSGMDMMKQYGHFFTNTKVIFLTAFVDYVFDGYKVNAYRFLMKPAKQEDLLEIFEENEKQQVLRSTLAVSFTKTDVSVKLEDIIYIEVFHNDSQIVIPHTTLSTRTSLKDIMQLLPEQYFYRISKSCIVNLTHVRECQKNTAALIMSNGEKLSVAVRKRKGFETAYLNYRIKG